MFRVYAIVYSKHCAKIEELDAMAHINTSFKHFLYFLWEFNLVNSEELEALPALVPDIRSKYDAERK
jgi:MOB kinase activator 1